MPNRTDLSPGDLERLRGLLEAERDEVLEQVEELEAEADLSRWREGGFDDDPADSGSASTERERAQSLSDHARALLQQIRAAVARMEEGTFGWCRRCGEPIGLERLEALPYAELCVGCKQLEERGR